MENPYPFVAGDPVNYADPSGLAPDCELTIEFHVIDGRVRAAVYCANVPGGRLPPTYIHPQDFSRADASANFGNALRRGGDFLAGSLPGVATAHDAWTLLSGVNAITGEQVGFSGRVLAGIGLATPVSAAQIRAMRSAWTAARRSYWRRHGPNGVAPYRDVEIIDRHGRRRQIRETQELHHKTPIREGGTHADENLERVWPDEHQAIDKHRRTGYVILSILKGH